MCHLYFVLLLLLFLFNFLFFYFYYFIDRCALLRCGNQATYNFNVSVLIIIFIILLGSVCIHDDWC